MALQATLPGQLAAAKTALLSQIQARLPGVQVTARKAAEDTNVNETVFLDGSSIDRGEHVAFGSPGSSSRSGRLSIEVVVQVGRGGNEGNWASERALALAVEVEEAVKDDYSLGGSVGPHAALVTRVEDTTFKAEGRNVWLSQVVVQVESETRVR